MNLIQPHGNALDILEWWPMNLRHKVWDQILNAKETSKTNHGQVFIEISNGIGETFNWSYKVDKLNTGFELLRIDINKDSFLSMQKTEFHAELAG